MWFLIPIIGAIAYYAQKPKQQISQPTYAPTYTPVPVTAQKQPAAQILTGYTTLDNLLAGFKSSFSDIVESAQNVSFSNLSYNMNQAPTIKSNPIQSGALLDLIGQHESGGNYNIVWGGNSYNLTGSTIDQVLNLQQSFISKGAKSSAVGKYQFIRKTLLGLKSELRIDGSTLFNQSLQDRLALHLLKKRGLDKYLQGKISESTFMRNISMEWASFPKDTGGQSYYAGDGLNKAGVSPSTVIAALRQVKQTGVA